MLRSCRLLTLLALGICASASGQDALSAQDRADILKTVEAIRAAILAGRADEVLNHISSTQGLSCTDTKYSYESIKGFLADTHSHLYMALFDSLSFARRCSSQYPPQYPAISDREFLKTAELSAAATLVRRDWVEVTIKSQVPNHYPRQWHLHKEGGVWKLAGDSLIIGSCSCG